jgi:5-methyltetrahydrofolate--homocysteine methyltransferase
VIFDGASQILSLAPQMAGDCAPTKTAMFSSRMLICVVFLKSADCHFFMFSPRGALLSAVIRERVLVLDGAMGTLIQKSVAKASPVDLACLTHPDRVRTIHRRYLEAGADIIQTNTFNANSITVGDANLVARINGAAASLARQAADAHSATRPRFVAGSVGPTTRSLSLAQGDLTFESLSQSYFGQIDSLIEGGVDLLLIETVVDSRNAVAALSAASEVMRRGKEELPAVVSVTISRDGRLISGQSLGEFVATIAPWNVFAVGINCSFGAAHMKPFLQELSGQSQKYVVACPSAGLPGCEDTVESMAVCIREFLDERLVNIVGGCCGTDEKFIARFVELAKVAVPRALPKIHKSLEPEPLPMEMDQSGIK